jgi:hypothetical protein
MATMSKFNVFLEDLAEKVHNLGADALTLALFPAASAPSATSANLAAIGTQAVYTYCSTRVVTITTSAQTSGTYKLCLTDHVLTATGGSVGPFRYLVLYNDTAASDQLIGWFDYTSDVTLAAGETFTLNFDEANGVIQIA